MMAYKSSSPLKVRFTQGIMQAKVATAYLYETFRVPPMVT